MRDNTHFIVENGNDKILGTVGELIDKDGFSIKINKVDALPGTVFTISYVTKLRAITDLQESLSISDQGKDTGMLTISLTGEDPVLIKK